MTGALEEVPLTRAWPMRGPVLLGLIALIALIGGFGAWSVTARLSGAVLAAGRLEVERNRQVVQHPDGGVVAAIRVSEGQSVRAGDVLIRLDGTFLHSELAVVSDQLAGLAAQKARLEAERDSLEKIVFPEALLGAGARQPQIQGLIDAQIGLFDIRRAAMTQEIGQLAQQSSQITARIEGIEAQARAIGIQLALVRDELASQKSLLARGLTQAGSVLALQREDARLLGEQGNLASLHAQAEERLTEIEAAVSSMALRRRAEAGEQLRELAAQEADLTGRQAMLRARIGRLDIRSPVAGQVLGLGVTTPGAVIRPADPLLYIMPRDRPLVITVQVAPQDIDEVHPGQSVDVVFPAFSARNTPPFPGHVTLISADAFIDHASQTSFYRVEISLRGTGLAGPEPLRLLPGMPVEAFIRTRARSPAAYLLGPFTDYFSRALQES